MTTAVQFQKLVRCMEEFPHLATGSPQFGSSKAALEQTWDTVAKKINAYGPPARSGAEWKKVWSDLKSRLKKKISDNNKTLHETGGGPCRVSNLTDLENDIDRICHMSAAAAPSGKIFGTCQKSTLPTPKHQNIFDTTPPRGSKQIAVVTPTSAAKQLKKESQEEQSMQPWLILNTSPSLQIAPTKFPELDNSVAKKSAEPTTLKQLKQQDFRKINASQTNRKKKRYNSEGESSERIELLRRQCQIQEETLIAIKTQAEAAKECGNAVRECTEAIKSQTESLKVMADSIKLMSTAMCDIVEHLTAEIIIENNTTQLNF